MSELQLLELLILKAPQNCKKRLLSLLVGACIRGCNLGCSARNMRGKSLAKLTAGSSESIAAIKSRREQRMRLHLERKPMPCK